MFRQYGGLFSDAEKELALKRITKARRQTMVCLPVQSMGKPVVVVPSASSSNSLRVPIRFERRVPIRFERRVIIIINRFERRVTNRFERRVTILFRFERRVPNRFERRVIIFIRFKRRVSKQRINSCSRSTNGIRIYSTRSQNNSTSCSTNKKE